MNEEKIEIKVNLTTVDQLMYVLQQVTGAPTDEILGFFNDLGRSVVEIGVKNMKGNQRSIRKTISDYFPNSSVPFQLLVTGYKHSRTWDNTLKKYKDGPSFTADVNVGFPSKGTHQNNDKLMEIVAEKALLGGCSLPDFEKPPTKTPKMYKQLMQSIYDTHKKDKDANLRDS